jgi:hypothetical protein
MSLHCIYRPGQGVNWEFDKKKEIGDTERKSQAPSANPGKIPNPMLQLPRKTPETLEDEQEDEDEDK